MGCANVSLTQARFFWSYSLCCLWLTLEEEVLLLLDLENCEGWEIRVMDVRFDEHGERFRPWREVVASLVEDRFDDGWPVPGRWTALWLCKTFSTASLTPNQWIERFLVSFCSQRA